MLADIGVSMVILPLTSKPTVHRRPDDCRAAKQKCKVRSTNKLKNQQIKQCMRISSTAAVRCGNEFQRSSAGSRLRIRPPGAADRSVRRWRPDDGNNVNPKLPNFSQKRELQKKRAPGTKLDVFKFLKIAFGQLFFSVGKL